MWDGLWSRGRLCSTERRGREPWGSGAACSRSSRCHHHTGVCKYQPLPLPPLCRCRWWPAPPTEEQQGREGTKPSIPQELSAQQVLCHQLQPMEHQPPATADSWVQDGHQQSMPGLSPLLPGRRQFVGADRLGRLAGEAHEVQQGNSRSFLLWSRVSPCDKVALLLVWS